MIEAAGFHVTYFDGAFKVNSPHNEGCHYTPASRRLRKAIDWGMKSVYEKGEGQWMVVDTNVFGNKDPDDGVTYHVDGVTARLIFFVPRDSDRRTELLAAVAYFEEVVSEYFGVPIDTTLRSVEEDEPQCKVCGKKPDWVRHTQPGRDDYFCISHAQSAYDFFTPTRLLSWEELESAIT